jgi:hypothetical protein
LEAEKIRGVGDGWRRRTALACTFTGSGRSRRATKWVIIDR